MPQIDDGLEARFESGVRQFSPPDFGDLASRRRRRDLRDRSVRTGLALVVVVATAAVFVVARSSFGPDADAPSPASPSFDPTAYATYDITDVGLRRPEFSEGGVDGYPSGTFIVSFKASWSGDQYPGEHDCRWSVLNTSGEEIGASEGSVSVLGPEPSDERGIGVQVDGRPRKAATAEVTCDPARTDIPVAYDISDEPVTGTFKWRDDSDPGVMIEFRVGWPVESPAYPSENWCTVALYRPDGAQVASQVFTLATGPGLTDHRIWPDEFSDPSAVADASTLTADVTCEPYTGLQSEPFDRQLAVVSLDMEELLDLTPDETGKVYLDASKLGGSGSASTRWMPTSWRQRWTPSRS